MLADFRIKLNSIEFLVKNTLKTFLSNKTYLYEVDNKYILYKISKSGKVSFIKVYKNLNDEFPYKEYYLYGFNDRESVLGTIITYDENGKEHSFCNQPSTVMYNMDGKISHYEYKFHGKLHNTKGPASVGICFDGTKDSYYFVNGIFYDITDESEGFKYTIAAATFEH